MTGRALAALTLVSAGLGGCASGGAQGGASGRAGQHGPGAPAAAAPAALAPPRRGETYAAALVARTALRASPSASARVVATVARRTRFGSPAVLAVVLQRRDWVGVVAPELGNGRVGWVRVARVRMLREQWAIRVDLSARRATLWRLGRRVRSFAVAVGAPAYPTPIGRFGVTDRLRTGRSGAVYGCCVLALSGEQPNIPQDWHGGDRLAIHGTNDPASIGTAASHGCLRASEADLRMLLRRVPLGTQVLIGA